MASLSLHGVTVPNYSGKKANRSLVVSALNIVKQDTVGCPMRGKKGAAMGRVWMYKYHSI